MSKVELRNIMVCFISVFILTSCYDDDKDDDSENSNACDLDNLDLLEFPAWQRENGYWVGEYTLLGADGNPSQSDSWPYRYDNYKGFIRLDVQGNSIVQRNVFLYPPQQASLCESGDDVIGNGTCNINGNEKVFDAAQTASDCEGSLSGPYEAFGMVMNTQTTVISDDTVLYQVRLEDGSLTQNQLTSLPTENNRIRTAQGMFMGNPTYASFYRETKVSEEAFYQQLEQARSDYNILQEDACAWDSNGVATGISCEQHFDTETPLE